MMDLSSFTPGSALVTVILIALAPFFAVMVTSFTKIVVVLSLLRNALGLQQVPPNIVLNGLALILTAYVMNPTLTEMAVASGYAGAAGGDAASVAAYDDGSGEEAAGGGAEPGATGTRDILSTADRAKEPLRRFLYRHTKADERAFFARTQAAIQKAHGPGARGAATGALSATRDAAGPPGGTLPPGVGTGTVTGAAAPPGLAPAQTPTAAAIAETDFVVLIPAFVVRELKLAFEIGFYIFLPFLVIDLVIANILMALGMMMLSPTTISLPFKILLFVLIDGWVKLSHSLVAGYA